MWSPFDMIGSDLWWIAVVASPYFPILMVMAVTGGVWFLIEMAIVGSRWRRGETLWSAISRHSSGRKFRPRANKHLQLSSKLLLSDEPTSEAEVTIKQSIPTVSEPHIDQEEYMSTLTEEKIAPTPTLIQTPSHTYTQRPIQFDVDASADMIEIMFMVKSGMLKVLWSQRTVEETAGNVVGVRAVDVLIADVEGTDVQKIWVLGDTKLKMTNS